MPKPTWHLFTDDSHAVALVGLQLPDDGRCVGIKPWAFRLGVTRGGETRWLDSIEVWLHDGPSKYDRWKHSLAQPITISPTDDDPAPDGWIRLHVVVPRLRQHEEWQITAVEVNDTAWEVKECDEP